MVTSDIAHNDVFCGSCHPALPREGALASPHHGHPSTDDDEAMAFPVTIRDQKKGLKSRDQLLDFASQ